jgi:large subunit ribosomal protein L22
MKRIRPAPMGRAFRYVRRISHIEIELAERGKNGEAVAHVVGEAHAAAPAKKTAAKKKSAGNSKKKAAAKK